MKFQNNDNVIKENPPRELLGRNEIENSLIGHSQPLFLYFRVFNIVDI